MDASCSNCGGDDSGTDYCSCQRQIVRPKKLIRPKKNNELAGGDYFHKESCGQQYVVPARQPRPTACQCQVCVSFPTLGSVLSKWKKESKKLFKIRKFACSWDDDVSGGGYDDGDIFGIKGEKVWTR